MNRHEDSLSDSDSDSSEECRPKKQNKLLFVIDESLVDNEFNKLYSNSPGIKKIHFGNIDKESKGTYDAILSGMLNHYVPCNMDILAVYIELLVPGGHLIVKTEPNILEEVFKTIKISGFLHVVMNHYTNKIAANSPPYKIGSRDKITLNSETKENVISTSKLDDNNTETISKNDLLGADNLKKPASPLLGVCATSKKAEACKDCSCELDEEFEAACKLEVAPKSDTSNGKNSCECASM